MLVKTYCGFGSGFLICVVSPPIPADEPLSSVIARFVEYSLLNSIKLWLSVPTEVGFKTTARLSEDRAGRSAWQTTADIVLEIALTSIDTRPGGGAGCACVGWAVSISKGVTP